jgi:hypothetical protein
MCIYISGKTIEGRETVYCQDHRLKLFRARLSTQPPPPKNSFPEEGSSKSPNTKK